MRKIKFLTLGILSFSILLSFPSCKKKDKNEGPTTYWFRLFYTGNFKINNQDVVTYKDVATNVKTADFVKKSDLPLDGFNEFSLQIYVPTDTLLYTTEMTDVQVDIRAGQTKSSTSVTVAFQQNIILDSLQYSIYQIKATTPLFDSCNANNFDDIKFTSSVHYKNEATTVQSRTMTTYIYKKDL